MNNTRTPLHGWDRSNAAEWAPVPASSVQAQRDAAREFDALESTGWDRADAAQWARVPNAGVRLMPLVAAFVLIVAGAVVGVLYSVAGAWNGATLAGIGLVVAGLVITIKELRR